MHCLHSTFLGFCEKIQRHIIRVGFETMTFARANPNFMALLYCKQIVGACGSREFCAYDERISHVTGEFWLVHLHVHVLQITRHFTLRVFYSKSCAEIWQMVIVSPKNRRIAEP